MRGNWKLKSIAAAILAGTILMSASACSPSSGKGTDTADDATDGDTTSDAVTEPPVIGEASRLPQGETPTFSDVSVHDPSVTKVGDTYYIIGSHMQAAKSTDLMHWTSVSAGVDNGSKKTPLFEGRLNEELKAAVTWVGNELYWAADWIQLRADGKFYMYYCVATGNTPKACIGMAVADSIEGPYTDQGIIIRSESADGIPSAVDPQVFYDKEDRMWMVYGSYSDGIYITELNPETGKPLNSGYGTKLTGGNHTPIEGAYIIYSPETDYYYLFTSFGGLSYNDGYNMRVSRCKTPDGRYEDYAGKMMIKAAGASAAFDTSKIQNYGLKLFGNYLWRKGPDDTGTGKQGYVSSGHNSVYYDSETGRYFLIFHTRFPGEGEAHQVRVHQMFMNEDGWPVVAPCRYAGETIGDYVGENIIGTFKYVNHGHEITSDIKRSTQIELNADYTVTDTDSGEQLGTWMLSDGHYATITIGGVIYKGVFLFQWDDFAGAYVMTFTASCEEGSTIWGVQVYVP